MTADLSSPMARSQHKRPMCEADDQLLRRARWGRDLKGMSLVQLVELCDEIRSYLVAAVRRSGGHLGPNLGVVELTVALHRVFESPRDRLLWDTGHQAYVHKLLTGRCDLSHLRQRGGISGYLSRSESDHDVIENSHASTVLAYADGLSRADLINRVYDRHVVAVIGDGALTGGMSWEGLNNLAVGSRRPVVIVVNDNGRSYAPTVGGLARHLQDLRRAGAGTEVDKDPARSSPAARPDSLFQNIGFDYIGPVDGHDLSALEAAFTCASRKERSVVVHCITRKGCGYPPAEDDQCDHFHGIAAVPERPGLADDDPAPTWTSAFGEEILHIGQVRPDVVAVTAAMLDPVGLAPFAAAFPNRTFDVGIAEQHATAAAAGLAAGGLHPVVALYATFANRAFDQVLMDVALHRAAVTFVLDRAGVTGDDGASHNGVWDLSIFQVVPGLQLAAPRDIPRLRESLRDAVAVSDAPTVVRYPKGVAPTPIEAVRRVGQVDVLRDPSPGPSWSRILLISIGALAGMCVEVAERLTERGLAVTVVDPRWLKPVDRALFELGRSHDRIVTVEDNVRIGGAGAAIAQSLTDWGVEVPCHNQGVPAEFLMQGRRAQVLAEVGLCADLLTAQIWRLASGQAQDLAAVDELGLVV